jgi:predicted HTH domain antitoxin
MFSSPIGLSEKNFMSQIILDLPEETLSALKLSPEQAKEEIRFTSAVKLYELGRLSSGAAANLAGVPRTVFLSKLAEYAVDTFCLSEEDLLKETKLG